MTSTPVPPGDTVIDVRDPAPRFALVMLDTIGVMIAGSRAPEVQALARTYGAPAARCTMLGQPLRAGAPNAALVNATAAAWLDFDSPHAHPRGQPMRSSAHYVCHIVPAALAAAEIMNATGWDFMCAVLGGYEWSARVGDRWHQRPGVHPHGTVPAIGAAMAAARLLYDGREAEVDAGRRAAMLTLMPPYSDALQGATVRNGFAGMGAFLGVLAAQLPRGFTAISGPVNRIFGEVSGTRLDSEPADRRGFEVERACFKLYPCARYLHATIEAARAVDARGVEPDAIRSVEVDTYGLAADLDNRIACPGSALEARFSLPFTAAVAVTRGDVVPADFEQRLTDPGVLAVARRVTVRASDAMTAKAPDQLSACVRVSLHDGRELVGEGSAIGVDVPLATVADRVRQKFRRLATPVLGAAGAEKAMAEIMQLERVDAMRGWLDRVTAPATDQDRQGES